MAVKRAQPALGTSPCLGQETVFKWFDTKGHVTTSAVANPLLQDLVLRFGTGPKKEDKDSLDHLFSNVESSETL